MPKTKADRSWRCDCGGGHFISVTWWPEDERDDTATVDGYLAVEGDFWRTLRHRLRMAFGVIRSGHADTRVGVVLTPDRAREIAAALTEYAESAAARYDR